MEEKCNKSMGEVKKSTAIRLTTKGRISRSVFWKYFGAAILLQFSALAVLGQAIGNPDDASFSLMQILIAIAAGIVIIFAIILNLCGHIRRIQDLGISQWALLPIFIPYLNMFIAPIFTIICGCIPGKDKPNKYGAETNVL